MITSKIDITGTMQALREFEEAQRVLDARVKFLKEEIARLEAELLDQKGPCSNAKCRLHYAHSGPCEPKE